jgi:hypothetical protein
MFHSWSKTAAVGLLAFALIPALIIVLPSLIGATDAAATEFSWLVLLYGLTVAGPFPWRCLGTRVA